MPNKTRGELKQRKKRQQEFMQKWKKYKEYHQAGRLLKWTSQADSMLKNSGISHSPPKTKDRMPTVNKKKMDQRRSKSYKVKT